MTSKKYSSRLCRKRQEKTQAKQEIDSIYLLSGCGKRGCGDGRALSSTWNTPSDLICLDANSGAIVVSDTQNNTLRFISFDANEVIVHSLRNSPLTNPRGIALSWDMTALFVCDAGHHRIQCGMIPFTYLLEDMRLESFAGSGKKGHQDGLANSASFNQPTGVCVVEDAIFVADSGNHAIRQINQVEGRWMVRTIAGGTKVGSASNQKSIRPQPQATGYADGPGFQALFRGPSTIARGKKDELIVTDTFNHCIRALLRQRDGWLVATIAGKGGKSGHLDGLCESTLFNQPTGICRASDGTLFVSDKCNNCIRHIGGYVTWRKYCWVRTIIIDDLASNWQFPSGFEPPFMLPRGLIELPSHFSWYNNSNSTDCQAKVVIGICDTGNHIIRAVSIDAAIQESTPVNVALLDTMSSNSFNTDSATSSPTIPPLIVAKELKCVNEKSPLDSQQVDELQRLRDENNTLRQEHEAMQHVLSQAVETIEKLTQRVASRKLLELSH